MPDPFDRILSMDKKQKYLKIFSVFLLEMAWPGETRHQLCAVPELAETEVLNPKQQA